MLKENEPGSEIATALAALFDQTVMLFHRLRAEAEAVHTQGKLSAGLRGVLLELHRLGHQTVPQMARTRPVSRQHIQILVNRLLEDGFVELRPNPAHKRSSLVALTARGKQEVEATQRREEQLLSHLQVKLKPCDVKHAVETLKQVRAALEGDPWKLLTRKAGRR